MLIWHNIARRRSQSVLTIAMLTIMTFVMVLGVYQIMQQGIALSRERLGADALLMPSGTDAGGQELLFSAVPENIYMPGDILDQVRQLDGVAAAVVTIVAAIVDLLSGKKGQVPN